jgi:hypothetical protein
VAAESGTTDDLDTISGLANGSGGAVPNAVILFIFPDGGDTITVKHNTGNILTATAKDVVLADANQGLILRWDGASKWREVARHGGGSGGGMELIVQEADQTVNSGGTGATLVDSELEFAVAANEVWQFEGVILFTTAATPDIKFQATGPTGAVGAWGIVGNAGTTVQGNRTVLGTEQAFTAFTAGIIRFWGAIHNGANAGTLAIQFAQNTADAANTTILAGSYIKYQAES